MLVLISVAFLKIYFYAVFLYDLFGGFFVNVFTQIFDLKSRRSIHGWIKYIYHLYFLRILLIIDKYRLCSNICISPLNNKDDKGKDSLYQVT